MGALRWVRRARTIPGSGSGSQTASCAGRGTCVSGAFAGCRYLVERGLSRWPEWRSGCRTSSTRRLVRSLGAGLPCSARSRRRSEARVRRCRAVRSSRSSGGGIRGRMRFAAKIGLVLLAVGVLPVALLGLVSYTVSRDELQRTVGRMQTQAAEDLALFTERFVSDVAREPAALARAALPLDDFSPRRARASARPPVPAAPVPLGPRHRGRRQGAGGGPASSRAADPGARTRRSPGASRSATRTLDAFAPPPPRAARGATARSSSQRAVPRRARGPPRLAVALPARPNRAARRRDRPRATSRRASPSSRARSGRRVPRGRRGASVDRRTARPDAALTPGRAAALRRSASRADAAWSRARAPRRRGALARRVRAGAALRLGRGRRAAHGGRVQRRRAAPLLHGRLVACVALCSRSAVGCAPRAARDPPGAAALARGRGDRGGRLRHARGGARAGTRSPTSAARSRG